MNAASIFKLGVAWGSFSVGEVDQGIHTVLPGQVVATGEKENEEFGSLSELFSKIPPSNKLAEVLTNTLVVLSEDALDSYGLIYCGAIAYWATQQGIDIGEFNKLWVELFELFN